MHDADITNSNMLPHEVKINLNVFGALMLDRVGGHVDGADVVTIDQRSTPRRCMKLEEKLAQPGGFGNAISHSTILCLCTGSGHCVLSLRRPGNQVVPEENRITRCGFESIWTACPIGVNRRQSTQSAHPAKAAGEGVLGAVCLECSAGYASRQQGAAHADHACASKPAERHKRYPAW